MNLILHTKKIIAPNDIYSAYRRSSFAIRSRASRGTSHTLQQASGQVKIQTIYTTNMVIHNIKEPSHLRSRQSWLSWATSLSSGSLSSYWSISPTLTRGTLQFKWPLLVFHQQQSSAGPWTAPSQCIPVSSQDQIECCAVI